jgi:TIGR03009 family protein
MSAETAAETLENGLAPRPPPLLESRRPLEPSVVRRTRPFQPLSLAVALAVAAAAHDARGQAPAQAPAPAGQRVAAVPAAPQPPAPLSPQEQAALDRLLAAWEARNAAVSTWSCTFHKWEYNAWSPADAAGDRLAFAESTGELKYAAPDKGLFRVKESKQWSPEQRRYEVRSGDAGEHWVCNGESIYEFRHGERQLRETKLPAEMRGKAISDGPLPFVFGAKADTLKKRYWMRIITPPGVRDQIWLEAQPRYQVDAANFSKVELILQSRDLMPFAIQMFKPGGQDRDVYQFDPNTNLIDKGLDLIRDFAKPVTPFGYTYILEDGRGQP